MTTNQKQSYQFVRPNLYATKMGLVDPGNTITWWMYMADQIMGAFFDESKVLQAYDVLAIYGRMLRIKPDFIHDLKVENGMKYLHQFVHQNGLELSELALSVPNTKAWLGQVEELEEVVFGHGKIDNQKDFVIKLFTDLDDADLVLYVAKKLMKVTNSSFEDTELATELRLCGLYVEQHPYMFLEAGVHVQTVAAGFDPDLHGREQELAWTRFKYVQVLDALEEFETEDDPKPGDKSMTLEELQEKARQIRATLPEIREAMDKRHRRG